MEDDNKLVKQQYEKVATLREMGTNPYPASDGTVYQKIEDLRIYEEKTEEELNELKQNCSIAGRIKGGIRDFGSIIFFHLWDRTGPIQVALTKKVIGPETFKFVSKMIDSGDIVGISGTIIKTRKGELTVHADKFSLLTKNVRPLPEKFHGLTDVEARYRQRYLDMIVNPDVAKIFRARSRIIALTRQFFNNREFLEVETPMMQPIAGGATARPFKTFHNALEMDLYLRVAPELYLKRLLVGGFERVFELNRNFRNEGISIRHNPEFTMLEFYQAYARFTDLMDLTEEFFLHIAMELKGQDWVEYQGEKISFKRPWKRLRMADAVLEHTDLNLEDLSDVEKLRAFCKANDLPVEGTEGPGKLMTLVFDKMVESSLIQPTFVYDYPTEVSPLARRNDERPDYTDRFEIFISGREYGNAFNELNDPEDQKERFAMQMRAKAAGDKEAHDYDQDYIRALEYGLPPTAGEGIGIDRLVMLFTDAASIRDVILFPQLRKEV